MDIALDEVIHFDAITTNPSTGAVSDADSTPSFEIFEEATDSSIVSANFTKRTSKTGNYRGTATLSAANGFEVGKWYSVVASATVNSIAGKAVVRNFRVVPAEAVAGYPKTDMWYANGDTISFGATPDVNLASWRGSTPAVLLNGRVQGEANVIFTGTLTSAAGTSAELATAPPQATGTADALKNMILRVETADLGAGQERWITASEASDSPTVTLNRAWSPNPTGLLTFSLRVNADLAPVDTRSVGGTTQTAGDLAALATAINAKTTNLPSDPADESLIIAATDAIMTRIGANGSGLTQVTATTVTDKTGYGLANGSIVTATFGTCDLTSTMKSSVTTAASAATPALSAAGVDAIWDELQSGHLTSGTFGLFLDQAISGVSTGGVSVTDIAAAVWNKLRADHTASGSFGQGVALKDGAIADATFTVPSLTTLATGPVGMLVQLWRRFFKRATLTSTTLITYADNNSTAVTTQTVSDTGGTQTQGPAS